jgi:hypothetical protein
VLHAAGEGPTVNSAHGPCAPSCKSNISPDMALRVAKAFNRSAETWAGIQLDYDCSSPPLPERDQRQASQKDPLITIIRNVAEASVFLD